MNFFTGTLQRISNLLLIKNGEQQQVLYFLILFFFIGAGMALGRGASEALFFKRYGIENLPLMYIIVSISLCSISLLYAAFVDRLPSEKFYKILFFLLSILLFVNWLSTSYGSSELVYPAFFLLYEVASELLLIHCAVYMNQNLVQTQLKRLAPIILAGHQIGVIAGGVLLAVASPYMGVKNMMLLWVLLLFASFLIISYWHSNNGVSPYFRAGRKGNSKLAQSLNQITQGIKLMKTSRLLRMSSFSLFFMVISVYILAYSVNSIYTEEFTTEESLSSFFGILTAVTGALALIIQLLLTNRLICNQGLKRVNYIFPLTSIFSFSTLLLSFALPSAIVGSFNKETLLPAFAKPVRNIFNAALPAQLQGRAQAISVIIFIPLGLACAGIFLLFAQNMDNINNFLIAGLLCSIAYLIFNIKMNQAYGQEILSNLKKSLFIPEKNLNCLLKGNQEELINDIEQGVMEREDDISIVYSRILSKSKPDSAAKLIPERMQGASNAAKDQMVKILQYIETKDLKEHFKKELGTGDAHLDATLLKALFQLRDANQKEKIDLLLDHKNPRIQAAAIFGTLHFPVPEHIEKAIDKWTALLESSHIDDQIPAIELVIPEFRKHYQNPHLLTNIQNRIRTLLQHDNNRFIRIALNILSSWPAGCFDDIEELILSLSSNSNWKIRKACIKASHLLSEKKRNKFLLTSLEDQHPNVRIAAIECLASNQDDNIAYIKHLLINRYSSSPKALQTMLEYLMDAGCDPNTMHTISISLANDAIELNSAYQTLKECTLNDSPEAILLTHALEERIMEITGLSLLAIQSSDKDETIAVIRAGLSSNDNRQFSHAYELLTMINNKELSELILPIFDNDVSTRKPKHDNVKFANLSSLVSWIQDRSDPWLNECASYFTKTLNNEHYV